MASQLDGVAALTAQLNELGVKVAARQMKGAVGAAMEIAEHKARAFMPTGIDPHKTYRGRLVSPGYALSTLHVEVKLNKKTGAAVASLGVGREAFYAVQFVELGTAHTPAQPWLRPAFEGSEAQMLEEISSELRERIGKITAKSKMRQSQRAGASRMATGRR